MAATAIVNKTDSFMRISLFLPTAIGRSWRFSEQDLGSELDSPCCLRRRDRSESRSAEEDVRQIEIRVIGNIERLCAELEIGMLAQTRVLDNRHVDALKSGPGDNIPPGIAKRAEGRQGERLRVEPLRWSRIRELRAPHQVWPVVCASESQDGIARVAVVEPRQQVHREWASRLERPDSQRLPAATKQSLTQRKIVGITQREALPHVEVRQSALGARVVTVLRKVRIAGTGEEARTIVNRL